MRKTETENENENEIPYRVKVGCAISIRNIKGIATYRNPRSMKWLRDVASEMGDEFQRCIS